MTACLRFLVWLMDDGLSFLYLQFSVMETALEGGSRAEVRELVAFYLRGREAATIGVYERECKRRVEYGEDAGSGAVSLELG